MTLSRKKYLLFAAAALTLSLAGVLLLLLAADLVLHRRAERSAGLNRYGYRGPVVGRKQPGELRVVMLGGSTVFGYGVAWNEAIPVYLEAGLRERAGGRAVSVVNLGFNNEGAHAFVPNLEDFAYLDYDVIVLYEGYNDLPGDEGVNRNVYRRNSAIFKMTGYYPILSLYLEEKVKMLRYGSDLSAAYETERRQGQRQGVVFRPGLAQRTSAAALETIATMTKALDGQLEKAGVAVPPPTAENESTLGCRFPYVTYCESVAAAVRFGRSRGKAVVVGAQPLLHGGRSLELHTRQREMLTAMMAREFGDDRGVVFANLAKFVDLTNADLTFDGMHLKPEANAFVAAALVEPVLNVAAGRR